ncbi:MAG: hypothetical protein SGILL_000339 [Bacillariaceae sp.]
MDAKLRKLEETGFSGAPSDTQSLAAMTTGGRFVGKNSDPKARLDALMQLQRSNSDSNLNGKKKKKKKDKDKRRSGTGSAANSPSKSSSSALSKKIRKSGRRATDSDITSLSSHAKTTTSRARSKSSNRRSQMQRNKSLTYLATMKDDGDDDKQKKKKSKEKRSTDLKDDLSKESTDATTIKSEDKPKKDKKKKRAKSDFVGGVSVSDDASASVASRTSTLASGEGSEQLSPLGISPKTKSKKKKDKDKTKPRRTKSTSDVLDPPLAGIKEISMMMSMDSTEGEMPLSKGEPLQVESKARRSRSRGSSVGRRSRSKGALEGNKRKKAQRRHSGTGLSNSVHTSKPVPQRGLLRRHSSADLKEFAELANGAGEAVVGDGCSKGNGNASMDTFEAAWATDQAAAAREAENAAARAAGVQKDLDTAIAGRKAIGDSVEGGEQREKILSLQNQLAEALDKMVAISREQIQDKDQFLKVSAELSKTKTQLMQVAEERTELVQEIKERDGIVEEERERIGKLEQAIERQLDTQDALEVKLERSEDEVEKLLIEMHDLEARIDSGAAGEGGGGGASLTELRETKKALEDKEVEVQSQIERIEKLEQELKDSLTVPQLQIEEMESENKALQGKLKAERLEYSKQLEVKDKAMAQLHQQVDSFSGTADAPDLVSARQKLNEAREDATAVREDLESAKKMIEQLQEEREDLLQRNTSLKATIGSLEKDVQDLTDRSDMLNEKVKQWTERTYEWKSKAESAERKLDAIEDSDAGSEASGEVVDEAPQGLFLQAAMEKNSDKNKGNKWNIFQQKGKEGQDDTADDIRIRTLEDRNQTLEDVVAELRSEMVKIQAAHKDELYSTQKRIAQLEGENEALTLQNSTLEQISRANH